jgi:hypothetical protein
LSMSALRRRAARALLGVADSGRLR